MVSQKMQNNYKNLLSHLTSEVAHQHTSLLHRDQAPFKSARGAMNSLHGGG